MSYTLVTGTKNWSSWSLRAWLALKATGNEFTEIVVPLRRPESEIQIRAQSPSGRIPVLKVNDGDSDETVFDSLAICETLAERHPSAKLWPTNPRSRALARAYAAEMHSGFLALREALPMDFARVLPTPLLHSEVNAQIARVHSAWRIALAHHRAEGPFLFGQFSIADCMYAPVVSRFATYSINSSQDIQPYEKAILALPAMQEWRTESEREIADGLPDQWLVNMRRNAR